MIVSTTIELTKKAIELPSKGYQDSLFQSAGYFDWVQKAPRGEKRDEFETYVDARKAIAGFGLSKTWPDPKSQEFGTALLGHVFQLGSLKNVIGVVGTDEGLSLDLHADLSSEQITPEQERLYRTRGFDRPTLLQDAARLAPRDTALFVYLHAPIGDFLRMMLASAEPALRSNLEDLFRSTGKYPSLDKLVAELDASLKDRCAIIIRPNDYPADPEGPPHNDAPVPAMALVLWPKNVETINSLRKLVGDQGSRFGLQGKTPNDPGFFQNSESGYETREYWSRNVDGTGVIVTANAAQLTIVTNSLGMMGHLLKTYTQKSDRYPSLADDPQFQFAVDSALPQANLIAYANPATVAPILRNRAQQIASIAATSRFDARTERQRVDAKILREQYGGRTAEDLSPPERAEFEAKGEAEMKAIRGRLKGEQVPVLMAEQERRIAWMEGTQSALLMLALNPKASISRCACERSRRQVARPRAARPRAERASRPRAARLAEWCPGLDRTSMGISPEHPQACASPPIPPPGRFGGGAGRSRIGSDRERGSSRIDMLPAALRSCALDDTRLHELRAARPCRNHRKCLDRTGRRSDRGDQPESWPGRDARRGSEDRRSLRRRHGIQGVLKGRLVDLRREKRSAARSRGARLAPRCGPSAEADARGVRRDPRRVPQSARPLLLLHRRERLGGDGILNEDRDGRGLRHPPSTSRRRSTTTCARPTTARAGSAAKFVAQALMRTTRTTARSSDQAR